jgi:hypothetical protein
VTTYCTHKEPLRTTRRNPKIGVAPLSSCLTEPFPGILERFQKETGASRKKAQEIFTETQKWLWLCGRYRLDLQRRKRLGFSLGITPELKLIDEMWHQYILFSREYTEYCDTYLGGYVHHAPEVGADHAARKSSLSKRELTAMYSYIYDQLGAETLQDWYDV